MLGYCIVVYSIFYSLTVFLKLNIKKNGLFSQSIIRLTLKVVRPGFEPRQTEPKTVVLPLYYRTMSLKSQRLRFFLFDDAKIEICFKNQNSN